MLMMQLPAPPVQRTVGEAAGVSNDVLEVVGRRRPTARQSEIDAGARLGPGYSPQVSYRGGYRERYGASGSVRPDFIDCVNCISVEVKNYDISRPGGIGALTRDISKQAKERAVQLPVNTVQRVMIDVRGQALSLDARRKIENDIVKKSNGIVKIENIVFF
jgi:hypothetical protein